MKPLKEITPDDIKVMADDEFTGLILIVGPIGPPMNEERYMDFRDWSRIAKLFGCEGNFEGTTHTFALRLVRDGLLEDRDA